jgi:hypothetical protein
MADPHVPPRSEADPAARPDLPGAAAIAGEAFGGKVDGDRPLLGENGGLATYHPMSHGMAPPRRSPRKVPWPQ